MDTIENKAAALEEGKAAAEKKFIPVEGKNIEGVLKLKEHSCIEMVESKFTFRKVEEVDTDGKKTGVTTKREPVTLNIPMPTEDGILLALQDDKQKAFIVDVVQEQVRMQVRSLLGDQVDLKSQDELDLSQLTLEYIANISPETRRGGGISKETWDAFVEDYVSIMPALTDRPLEKVRNAAALFIKRLQPVKTHKVVLKQLKSYLDLWLLHTKLGEELAEVYQFLDKKIEEFLAKDDASYLESL